VTQHGLLARGKGGVLYCKTGAYSILMVLVCGGGDDGDCMDDDESDESATKK
jgi:hypothetical protein